MGGGNSGQQDHCPGFDGLSPRGRGKLNPGRGRITGIGSIPAWAGETHPTPGPYPRPSVYPRVGGGNFSLTSWGLCAAGLSPRGRGKRKLFNGYSRKKGSIPAWAGETTQAAVAEKAGQVYPRVGGGNLVAATLLTALLGLSPRGRGKLRWSLSILPKVRSIPAWAGETCGSSSR